MVRKVFNIQLDLKQASTNPRMIVVGGDTANFFLVTLTDDGEPVDLTDCRVIAVFSTSAGLAAQDGGSDEGGISIGGLYNNEITIELFNGSYSYDGLTQCEIQVYSGEDLSTLATSAKFSFRANRPILNDESIVQTREFPILTSLISEVKELRDAYNSIIKENGDMTMEVYDVDENGIVDDAERLGGELPEHYATSEGVAAIQDTISTLRVDLDAVGEVVETLTPDDIGAASLDEYGAVPGTQNFSHMTWFSDEQRTLQQSDAGRTLMPYDSDNPGKAYTINIPANSDVEINRDAEFAVFRYFEGTITVVPASGVGLRYIGVDDSSINRPIRIANRYGMVALKKISNTAWIVTGDIEEA